MEKNSNCLIINQIIECFTQDSLPRMALLDGGWGIGKTHFVKNELKVKIEKELKGQVHYLSLFGISKTEEFKELLLSKYYFSSDDTQSTLEAIFSTSSEILSKIDPEKGGVLSAISSGLSGVAKKKMESSIKDICFLIDDVERVDYLLLKNMLGESHVLTENNQNVSFLFIGNNSKSNFLNDDSEKLFSEIIEFTQNASSYIKTLLCSDFQSDDRIHTTIININAELDVNNLRLIQRSLVLLNKLWSKFKSNKKPEINGLVFIKSVYSVSTAIILARYQLNTNYSDFEELKNYHFENDLLSFKVNDKLANDNNKDLSEKPDLSRINISKALNKNIDVNFVKYCYGFHIESPHIKASINKLIPSLSDDLDTFYYQLHESTEHFDCYIIKLKEYLIDKKEPDIISWFYYAGHYINFVESKFITDELSVKNKNTENYLIELASSKVFTKNYVDVFITQRMADIKKNNKLYVKYLECEKKAEQRLTSEKLQKLITKAKDKWDFELDSEFYKYYSNEPIVAKLLPSLKISLKSNWKVNDIELFTDFLKVRYPVNVQGSNKDQLQIDIDSLDELYQWLTTEFKDVDASQKTGLINLLSKQLTEICTNYKC